MTLSFDTLQCIGAVLAVHGRRFPHLLAAVDQELAELDRARAWAILALAQTTEHAAMVAETTPPTTESETTP